jgi:hypothetical protein
MYVDPLIKRNLQKISQGLTISRFKLKWSYNTIKDLEKNEN